VFGRGWTLTLPSITRGTGRVLPRYRDAGLQADGYVASLYGELVPLRDAGGESAALIRDGYEVTRFRARTELAFARLERWRELATGLIHWRETSREGETRIYGQHAECRIADPGSSRSIAQWLLEEVRDPRGHVVRCVYKPDAANRHLKRLLWGNSRPTEAGDELFELVLDYGEHDPEHPSPDELTPWTLRADVHSSRRTGFELETRRLCQRRLSSSAPTSCHTTPRPAAAY
jgi:hypothetical protein